MKQFKYLRIPNPSDEELESLGNEGWELITVHSSYSGDLYIFKQEFSGNLTETAPSSTSPEEEVWKEAEKLYPGAKLQQIKHIKETLNCGLKEAKDLVDSHYKKSSAWDISFPA